jgi:hypothetical protein
MGIINTAGTVEQGGIGSTKCRLQTHTKPMEIPLFGTEPHYLAGEKAINLANKIFGCSSAIQNIQIDFVDEHTQTGKGITWSVGQAGDSSEGHEKGGASKSSGQGSRWIMRTNQPKLHRITLELPGYEQ